MSTRDESMIGYVFEGILAVQAMHGTDCPMWLALDAANVVYQRHRNDQISAQSYAQLYVETVALIDAYRNGTGPAPIVTLTSNDGTEREPDATTRALTDDEP